MIATAIAIEVWVLNTNDQFTQVMTQQQNKEHQVRQIECLFRKLEANCT